MWGWRPEWPGAGTSRLQIPFLYSPQPRCLHRRKNKITTAKKKHSTVFSNAALDANLDRKCSQSGHANDTVHTPINYRPDDSSPGWWRWTLARADQHSVTTQRGDALGLAWSPRVICRPIKLPRHSTTIPTTPRSSNTTWIRRLVRLPRPLRHPGCRPRARLLQLRVRRASRSCAVPQRSIR